MKMNTRIAVALAAACLAGCFSLEKGRIESIDREHVLVSNYGWYLFHYIPLACGNASLDAWTPFALFRDDVTLDKIQGRFMLHARDEGCTAENLTYETSESVMLEIPGLNTPLPIPYLLTYREIQLSGVLANEKEADEK